MAGFSNNGTGLTVSGGFTLNANGLTLNANGTSVYGQGLTLQGVPAVDADVALWANAVVANGGTVSPNRLAIVSNFVTAEKTSGAWDLTDDYIGLWAENTPQALTSLKQRRLATAVNAPVFTADRGYAFDGLTNYINTGFNPAVDAATMTTSSNHFEIYERTNVGANTYSGGVSNASNRVIAIRARVTTSAALSANSAAANFTLPSATSLGLTQTGRAGTLTSDIYGARNGVDMPRTSLPSAVGTALPSNTVLLGALSNAGVASGFRATSIGYAAAGAALSAAQRLARYAAVQTWATSVGAQV